MSYESPIFEKIDEITNKIIKDREDTIIYQVNQTLGYEVDKKELERALLYDRDQYRKGYKDGFLAGQEALREEMQENERDRLD